MKQGSLCDQCWNEAVRRFALAGNVTTRTEMYEDILREVGSHENGHPDPPKRSRPTMEAVMMNVARLMADRSTCSRLQVGCVITNAEMTSIYSIGYNGNYRGGPHACDRDEPGNCGCLHAEDNALVKLRTEERNLVLFTTVSPCVACAKRIVNQGNIRDVWHAEAHREMDAAAFVLMEGNVSMRLIGD